VRADEAGHRDVNHAFAEELKEKRRGKQIAAPGEKSELEA